MITIAEAADKLRRSTKTLQRWDRKGILKPAARTKTNRRMYTVDQIEAFLGHTAKHYIVIFVGADAFARALRVDGPRCG